MGSALDEAIVGEDELARLGDAEGGVAELGEGASGPGAAHSHRSWRPVSVAKRQDSSVRFRQRQGLETGPGLALCGRATKRGGGRRRATWRGKKVSSVKLPMAALERVGGGSGHFGIFSSFS